MIEKQIDKEFRQFASARLISPRKCKKLEQTRHNISELHKKINEFKERFNYVPDTAHLLFSEYQAIQEKMVFENYKKVYYSEAC